MWSDELERRAAEMRRRSERKHPISRSGEEQLRIAEETAHTGATERHYTVQELSEVWKLSSATITRMFRDEPGVLAIGHRQLSRHSRSYVTLRVPESVVERVYRRMLIR